MSSRRARRTRQFSKGGAIGLERERIGAEKRPSQTGFSSRLLNARCPVFGCAGLNTASGKSAPTRSQFGNRRHLFKFRVALLVLIEKGDQPILTAIAHEDVRQAPADIRARPNLPRALGSTSPSAQSLGLGLAISPRPKRTFSFQHGCRPWLTCNRAEPNRIISPMWTVSSVQREVEKFSPNAPGPSSTGCMPISLRQSS